MSDPICDGLTPIDTTSTDYKAGEADGYEHGWKAAEVLNVLPPAVVVENPDENFRTYYFLTNFMGAAKWLSGDSGEALTGEQLLNYLGDTRWKLLR